MSLVLEMACGVQESLYLMINGNIGRGTSLR